MKRFLATVLILAGCGLMTGARRPRPTPPPTSTTPTAKPLAGLSQAQLTSWNNGKALFNKMWRDADGLGPFFTGESCAQCHGSEGNKSNLQNYSIDPILVEFGAPSLQTITIYDPAPDTSRHNSLEDPEDIDAQIRPLGYKVGTRRSKSVLGLGLVGAIPDADILALQTNGGKATKVKDLRTGAFVVGKLGMKGQRANAFDFTAVALRDEMGITNPVVPEEAAELNDPASLDRNPVPQMNTPIQTVNDITAFVQYSESPSQPLSTSSSVANGWAIFQSIGCATCHTRSFVTESADPLLDNVTIYPYSDFLMHDMDYAGDGVPLTVDQNDVQIPGSWMRTTPLWGLKYVNKLWHDSTINQGDYAGAINKHAGQGQAARDAYNKLSSTQKSYLTSFLNAL